MPLPNSFNWRVPMLDVMMIMVFLKPHGPSQAIRQPAFVHHLQQHVEHVGVSLLDFIQQYDGVRDDGVPFLSVVRLLRSPRIPEELRPDVTRWNFSMYSLMSIRIMASVVPNMFLASSFARCVFPTPVGPKKRNVPIGLFGSFSPTRIRWILLTNVSTALSCPITFESNACFIPFNRTPSACAIRCTGTPEIMDTTSSICGAFHRFPVVRLRSLLFPFIFQAFQLLRVLVFTVTEAGGQLEVL